MHLKICNNYVTRSRLAVERVSMSAGDLSRRMRVMRGKRRARPEGWFTTGISGGVARLAPGLWSRWRTRWLRAQPKRPLVA